MSDEQTADSVGAADDAASTPSGDLLKQPEQAAGDDAQQAAGEQQAPEGEQAEGNEQQAEPDEYADFSLPEGVELNEELLAQANPVFKELGLSQEQAQKLVDFESARVQAQVDQFHQQVDAWKEAAREDKEFGGDKLEQSLASANNVLKGNFAPAFIEELKQIGFLNHPELIRGLTRIGNRYLTEDTPGEGKAVEREKSRIERLYGTE